MSDEQRAAVLERAKHRGLTEHDLSSEQDLVISGRGASLEPGVAGLRPKIVKPRSIEDAIRVMGPPAEARRKIPQSERRLQLDRLRALSREIRPVRRRPMAARDEKDLARKQASFSNLAARMVVGGIVSQAELMDLGLASLLDDQIQRIDLRQWLLPSIVIQAGSTWTIGAGVNSVVAFRVTVEPGARILINQAPFALDCVHFEVH
ncbi:MAG: hypothetical protein KDK70_14305 [Myxococcales bacterium]|nr:hypothetical protein [Myxococcales bacterium]